MYVFSKFLNLHLSLWESESLFTYHLSVWITEKLQMRSGLDVVWIVNKKSLALRIYKLWVLCFQEYCWITSSAALCYDWLARDTRCTHLNLSTWREFGAAKDRQSASPLQALLRKAMLATGSSFKKRSYHFVWFSALIKDVNSGVNACRKCVNSTDSSGYRSL